MSEYDAWVAENLANAGIPRLYWAKTLPGLGKDGKALRAYLQGDYTADRGAGIGAYLWGKGLARSYALQTFAKELVLLQDNVQLLTLRKLVYVIEDRGGQDWRILERCKALCLTGFYEEGFACPYQGYELGKVEDFLRSRVEDGQRLYLSACKRLEEAEWWTPDFRAILGDRTREFVVNGKTNNG